MFTWNFFIHILLCQALCPHKFYLGEMVFMRALTCFFMEKRIISKLSLFCLIQWTDCELSYNTVTNRAYQTTAFLCRYLSSCSKDMKAKCYKSIVRPQLKYVLTVWDPVIKSNIAKIESLQRHAARFAAMTTDKSAVSLQCCKSLDSRTFNQGELRTKWQWCIGKSVTSLQSLQASTW